MAKINNICGYCSRKTPWKTNQIYKGYCSSECYKLHIKFSRGNKWLLDIPLGEHQDRKKLLMLAVMGDDISKLKLRLLYNLRSIWDQENKKEIKL